jgi:hypothetical protein
MRKEQRELTSHKSEDILAVVKEILGQPDVHRIVVDSDRGVLFYRREEGDGFEDDITLEGALRNARLDEYSNSEANPFEAVFDMLQLVEAEGLHAVCWATGSGSGDLLNRLFAMQERGMPAQIDDSLLGIPLVRQKSLPEETLILCAAQHDEDVGYEDVVVGIKTTIEVYDGRQEEPSSPDDRPVRDGSEERPAAARELEDDSPGLGGGSWIPPAISMRLGDD